MLWSEWLTVCMGHMYPNGYTVVTVLPPAYDVFMLNEITVDDVVIIAYNPRKEEYVVARVYPHLVACNEWHSGVYEKSFPAALVRASRLVR
jgi:hypothetical protein